MGSYMDKFNKWYNGLSQQQKNEYLDSIIKRNRPTLIPNDTLVQINIPKSINEYCTEAFETASSKGWHDEEVDIRTSLLLIHAEISEAVEALRKNDKDNFVEELADVAIRLFDTCGKHNIDLEGAIEAKMLKNKKRSYKHGGKAF